MLRVIQHYLPLRRALLILSETVLLTVVLAAAMTSHLLDPTRAVVIDLAHRSMSPDTAITRCVFSALLLSIIAQVAISFNELYDFRVSSSRYERASRFVESAGSALALTLMAMFLVDAWGLSTVLDFPGLSLSERVQSLVFSMLLGFALLYSWRHLFHFMMRRVRLNQRVLIIGDGWPAHSLARAMMDRPDSAFEAVGLLAISTAPPEGVERRQGERRGADHNLSELDNWSRLHAADAGDENTRSLVIKDFQTMARQERAQGHEDSYLLTLAQRLDADMIVVALVDRRVALPTDALLKCRLAGIEVKEREEVFEDLTGKLAVEAMRPSYLIYNAGFQRSPWADLMKRATDITLSLVILCLVWPFMVATALAIRWDSKGPVLFTQERTGRDGRSFTLIKFRSMRTDAEALSGPVWATEDDPRITRVGRFIRKTRLDELPQLFNVFTGSMSLIGPRPERPHFVDELAEQIPYFKQRHIVQPGVTGWAQINHPYGNTVEDALEKLQYDLFYIKNQSFLFDLSILFSTIKTVLLRRGT
ncbi:MAG: TIGR03013 family PEP-CTERM/XrtA system glycosyltransferase [Planctomycetota bacterium]|nr:TIGR03013 family PEP-CTERM/XrtA system glycosyltransferase [Planctomycetota bacterium]